MARAGSGAGAAEAGETEEAARASVNQSSKPCGSSALGGGCAVPTIAACARSAIRWVEGCVAKSLTKYQANHTAKSSTPNIAFAPVFLSALVQHPDLVSASSFSSTASIIKSP